MKPKQTPDHDRPGGQNLRQLALLGRYLGPYRRQVIGALGALVLAAAAVLSLGLCIRVFVDRGFGNSMAAIAEVMVILAGVVAMLSVATYGRFFLVSWIGERVVADIRRDVYAHVIRLPPAFFEVTNTGEVLSRLTTDTTLLQVVVGSTVSLALRNTLLLLGGIIMLVVTSAKLTAVVAVMVPVVVLPIVAFGRHVRRLSRATQDRIAEVGAHAEESVNAIRTVQAYNHEGIDRELFTARVESAFNTSIDRIRARALLTSMVMFTSFAAVALMLWVGANDVVNHRLTIGQMSQFLFFALVVAGAVGAISEVFGDLQRAAGATERLFELLSVPAGISAPANPTPLPVPAIGTIQFEHVAFAYPTRPGHLAVDDFHLSVAPGERVALVGPSGAGKSTIFQLLMRFYDPVRGTVRVDGVDLREADPHVVRARMALVPQDPVVFGANAWDNIRYGRPNASREQIRAAADAAAATEFIDRLPRGFETFLGERGQRLSGGQRQRIALARAILRDPTILLLDEATSSLDAESERLVQLGLERLMKGRTTLVIAHRLATVLKADRIVVMDQGRVVAIGKHHDLIAQGGLYEHLASLQFGLGLEPAAAVAG